MIVCDIRAIYWAGCKELNSRNCRLQAKYEHAIAKAQKSISQRTDPSSDEEDEEEEEDKPQGKAKAKEKSRGKDSLSAAEKVQQAAELVDAALKAQRNLQQLQASFCCA